MELLTIKQASALLKVSCTTVRDMVRRGEIPHLRVRRQIRFVREDIEAWVRSRVEGGFTWDQPGIESRGAPNEDAATAPQLHSSDLSLAQRTHA